MVPKLLSLIVDKILKPMRSTFEDVIYAIQGGSNLSICQSDKFLKAIIDHALFFCGAVSVLLL